MPRPALPIGGYGKIAIAADPTSTKARPLYKARARFRDGDGVVRPVARFGQTKGAAESALRAALAERAQNLHAGFSRDSRLAELEAEWRADFLRSNPAHNTRRTYLHMADKHILPRMGSLKLSEVTTKRCNDVLDAIATTSGASTAKSTRTVLSLILGAAVRHDAIRVNPVREVKTAAPRRKKPRALSKDQANHLGDLLRTHPAALDMDLPDLVDTMLATGARIGETVAIRRVLTDDGSTPSLDLEAGTVEINATVIRVKGDGLYVQERPKSAAGYRVLALPDFCVDMLRQRYATLRLHPPVVHLLDENNAPRESAQVRMAFPSKTSRTLLHPETASKHLRRILDGLECDACEHTGYQLMTADEIKKAKLDPAVRHFRTRGKEPIRCEEGPWAWFTSHALRKTVATWLDESGWTPRQVADQLGHAHPSMTQDFYFGRAVTNSAAAEALAR